MLSRIKSYFRLEQWPLLSSTLCHRQGSRPPTIPDRGSKGSHAEPIVFFSFLLTTLPFLFLLIPFFSFHFSDSRCARTGRLVNRLFPILTAWYVDFKGLDEGEKLINTSRILVLATFLLLLSTHYLLRWPTLLACSPLSFCRPPSLWRQQSLYSTSTLRTAPVLLDAKPRSRPSTLPLPSRLVHVSMHPTYCS